MLSTLIWRDEYLNWENLPEYQSIDYIFIPSYKLWQPDLELYNAGSSPELFELYGFDIADYHNATSYCANNGYVGDNGTSDDLLGLINFKKQEMIGLNF